MNANAETQIDREVVVIAEWLDTKDPGAVLRFKTALDTQGEKMDCLLGDLLRQDIAGYQRGKRLLWLLSAIAIMLLGVAAEQGMFYDGIAASASTLLIPAWLIAPFVLGCYADHCSYRSRMRNTVDLLTRRQSRQAIPPLIEAMACADADTRTLAVMGLTVLLPSMEAADARLLKPKHHKYLHRALRGCNSYLMLAVLKALERVGDGSDIAPVHQLTTCSVWIDRSCHIRKEARKCLTLICTHAAKQKIYQSLLRPASAGAASSALLLRPGLRRVQQAEPLHHFEAQQAVTITK